MRFRPRDLPALLGSALGRQQLAFHAWSTAWPAFHLAAWLHRRTLARRARVIAVVGSYGKTTSRAALVAALGIPATRARDKGRSSLPVSMLRIRPGQAHAVLEVAINRRRQMARHAGMVRPDVVVFTSVGSEHHRSLGTLDDILEEKARVLAGLRLGGLLVLNGDDPRVRALADRVDARVLTFGMGEDNDVRADDIRLDWPRGTRFTLRVGGEARDVRVPLLGRKMIYPALAAIAVATAEGRRIEAVLAALERLEPVSGRLQPVALPNGAWLLRDEFKSSLETIDAALDVLAEIPARRFVVLGDISEPPGSQGPHYRRLGGRLAGIATRAIIVGEHFRRYAAGATAAGLARSEIVNAGRSIRRVVDALRADLQPGDVVLIKGRNTQRLERIALALQDHVVACDIPVCRAANIRCERCPMLARGWPDPGHAAIVAAVPAAGG